MNPSRRSNTNPRLGRGHARLGFFLSGGVHDDRRTDGKRIAIAVIEKRVNH